LSYNFLPYLEWEILREPLIITNISPQKELPELKKRLEIKRGNDYKLLAILYFKDSSFTGNLRHSSNIAGSFHKGFDINCYYFASVCTLESCVLGKTTLRMGQEDSEQLDTSAINFQKLRIKSNSEEEGTHLVEWYLNGPTSHVFHGATERKVTRNYIRERVFSKEKIDSIDISKDSSSFGVDFLKIRIDDLQFLITKVPQGIGPVWSSNIGIEYRQTWGRIPDYFEREKIYEFCSFIFGRQLLPVGYTIYDKNEKVLESYAENPSGNAKSFCLNQYDLPPVRLFPVSTVGHDNAENIIEKLFPSYLELREPLCLKEALWNYWVSRDTPVGINLPILASAVESIINGWFKYTKSKSKGVFMPKNDFELLLKDEIESVTKKLRTIANGDKIVEKMLKAYELGIMERYRVFFEEINLAVNNPDWDAIRERHKFVHGHALFDDVDWECVIQHVRTLETLLNKILLKLLGYSGTFIDRSVIGWNDQQLV
jgi:hypothetical protein